MDQLTHSVRSSRWKDIVLRCQNRPDGMNAKQWMAENQVSENAYYYWQRKFRREAYEQMDSSSVLPAVQDNYEISFSEVRIPETRKLVSVSDTIHENISPTAIIKTSTMTIALSNDISESLLSRILKEVSHA